MMITMMIGNAKRVKVKRPPCLIPCHKYLLDGSTRVLLLVYHRSCSRPWCIPGGALKMITTRKADALNGYFDIIGKFKFDTCRPCYFETNILAHMDWMEHHILMIYLSTYPNNLRHFSSLHLQYFITANLKQASRMSSTTDRPRRQETSILGRGSIPYVGAKDQNPSLPFPTLRFYYAYFGLGASPWFGASS